MEYEFKSAWDDSFKNKDNYVFYSYEEIIRFVSKYFCKRIEFNQFLDQYGRWIHNK
jgi:hypothetical protein